MTVRTENDAVTAAMRIGTLAATVNVYLSSAMQRMNDMRGGYPSSASGADAGSGSASMTVVDEHGQLDQMPVSRTEAAAMSAQPDKAAEDHRELLDGLDRAYVLLYRLASLVEEYAAGRVDIRKMKASIDSIWCPNHALYNAFVPRGNGGRRRLCDWCYKFEHAEHGLPDRQLVEKHVAGRNLTEADVTAWRRRHEYRERQSRKKGRSAA